ncbi:MAG TPA: ATP-binding protein [Polyangiaceae bacterium]|nr:ATP-binding protein [Polyangiaceae bacterium]
MPIRDLPPPSSRAEIDSAKPGALQLAAFLGCIAHDFGNLVTLIGGHAAYLAQNSELTPSAREDAVAIRNAARRATHLVRHWLDSYRNSELHPEIVGLRDFMSELASLARSSLGQHIDLVVEDPPPGFAVLADREQLERSLLNLVLNARDALEGRGQIVFGATTDRNDTTRVVLFVRDDGRGVPRELRQRIFEPHFTTKAGGSGLGLPSVADFADRSGGRLELASPERGGAEFRLSLPRATAEPWSSPRSEWPRAAPSAGVLLIEPDVELARALEGVLRLGGYRVFVAHGPGDAVLIAERCNQELRFAVLESDLAWMDTDELLGLLKTHQPTLRAVLLSNDGRRRDDLPVLIKPFDPRSLLTELERQEDPELGKAAFSDSSSLTRLRTGAVPPGDAKRA